MFIKCALVVVVVVLMLLVVWAALWVQTTKTPKVKEVRLLIHQNRHVLKCCAASWGLH